MADMSKALNRAAVYVSGLQARFELPVLEGTAYSSAYLEFLRSVVALRTFNIPEETLRDLWHLEKKLLQLLHVDSTGSHTWFLDSCGAITHRERRLLLTNHDLGVPLTGSEVQIGLNFADSLPNYSPAKKWVRTPCAFCVNASKFAPTSSRNCPRNCHASAPLPNGRRRVPGGRHD